MAGAMIVGEFAWAMEALLHRVIDGSIEINTELKAFLGQVFRPLSELLAQVGGGPEPAIDFRAVMASAQRLTRGESITLPVSDTVTIVAQAPVIDAGENELELMDIFCRECRDHLGSIQNFVRDCEHSETDCHVTEPLYRALHTLAGIAESAQVSFISVGSDKSVYICVRDRFGTRTILPSIP